MKKTLFPCLLLAALCFGYLTICHGADPTDRFIAARILIQEGESAEGAQDWAKANAKYTEALAILNDVKAKNPEWNPNIIEFRIKHCQDRLAEVTPKVPATPPPPMPEPTPVPPPPPTPTPQPEVATPKPPVAPAPVPMPAAEESKRVKQLSTELRLAQDRNTHLQAQIDSLNAELKKAQSRPPEQRPDPRVDSLRQENVSLKAQLVTARREYDVALAKERAEESATLKRTRQELSKTQTELADVKRASGKAAELDKQNKALAEQVATLKKENAELSSQARIEENARLKQARADLDKTRAELVQVKRTSARALELEKQNKALSEQVTTLQKQNSDLQVKAKTEESARLKQTRLDLEKTRRELADLKRASGNAAELDKQNKTLTEQLTMIKKQNAELQSQVAARSESAEIKRLKGQVADAQADAARAKAEAKRVEALQVTNKELNTQVVALRRDNAALESKLAAKQPAESVELKKLRTELADAKAAQEKTTKQNVVQLEELRAQNKQLTEQLAAARKQTAMAPAAEPVKTDSAELKKVRFELADTKAALAKAQRSAGQAAELEKQNRQLNDQLAAAKKDFAALQSKATAKPSAEESAAVKQLRNELAEAKSAQAKAQRDASRADDLETQNTKLSDQLASVRRENTDLQRKMRGVKEPAADPKEIAQLQAKANAERAAAAKARQELEKANKELTEAQQAVGSNDDLIASLRRENSLLKYQLESIAQKHPELKGQYRGEPPPEKKSK